LIEYGSEDGNAEDKIGGGSETKDEKKREDGSHLRITPLDADLKIISI
jgi:hypothetical protein